MNKMLLSALILVPVCVASAWAEDNDQAQPVAATQPAASAPQAAAAQPATPQFPSVQGSRVVIELKGPAKSVAAMVAELEQDAVYKDAACSHAGKPGKTATITCANADSGLMAFVSHNLAEKVRWSISGSTVPNLFTTKALSNARTLSITPNACAAGCTAMNCPPPSGPPECCHFSNGAWRPCL